MPARQKLNVAAINGALAISGVLGVVCQSWTVFAVAAVILIGLSLHDGNIRPDARARHHD